MTNWQINSNGNDAEDIRDDYVKVVDAARDLQAALRALTANALHGRNYQTLVGGQELREDDVRDVTAHYAAATITYNWAMEGAARAIRQREGI